MILRCKTKTSTTSGIVTTTEAAAISPQGRSNSPGKSAMATGTVRILSAVMKVSESKNSFHALMKTRIAVVRRPWYSQRYHNAQEDLHWGAAVHLT